MQQGLAARQETGAELAQPYFLALQAEVYGKLRQSEHALTLISEALAAMHASGEHRLEAELYRIKGELTLQKTSRVQSPESEVQENQKTKVTDLRPLTPDSQDEAEACFLKAIDVARKQQAKSLELRATVSLAQLWQQQGNQHEAHTMLSDIYNWFSEGFDTKDLQEAKVLIEALQP
jgi:predicted ATPase